MTSPLTEHLVAYLGAWPPAQPVHVVGSQARTQPSWDGSVNPAVAVASPDGGVVVSVAPELAAATAAGLDGLAQPLTDEFRARVGAAVGAPGRVSPWVVMRWSTRPAPLARAGEWVDASHPALPDWLRVFTEPVLVALDDNGRYLAGLGIKRHTEWGRELAVGTDEAARGRGLARRLVAQAARAVLDQGAVPLYVHSADNAASARVADAAGFPDDGWRLLVVWGGTP